MGCASSKQIRATTPLDVDAYRPSATSLSVFDINSIEEPWLKHQIQQPTPPSSIVDGNSNNNNILVSYVPPPILEKLDSLEQLSETTTTAAIPPRSWDEISKALHDDLNNKSHAAATKTEREAISEEARPKAEEDRDRDRKADAAEKRLPRKSFSFHTLEELDASLRNSSSDSNSSRNKQTQVLRKTESVGSELNKKCTTESQQLGVPKPVVSSSEGRNNSLRNNPFIVKDKLEREKEGKTAALDKFLASRRDPLSNFPEKCPPNGATAVVLYTTSLRGVRRTFEDCNRVRTILETHGVVFDERDVSLHAGFLNELREVLGGGEEGGVSVPRMFVSGRYLGGAEEVVGLNESGRLGRILSWARIERGVGRSGCGGCGGARFVPCFECGGSCKVVVRRGDGSADKERCDECNENGLVHCPLCR